MLVQQSQLYYKFQSHNPQKRYFSEINSLKLIKIHTNKLQIWFKQQQKMNSIIKQITYDEFSPLIGRQKANRFIQQNEIAIICFITDWSVPSRTAIKKIKKKNIHKQKVGIIDVDLVDSIEVCDRYEIKTVPHFILFKNKEILSQFTGCRLQSIDQMFSKLDIDQKDKAKTNLTKCLKGHDLNLLSTLPYPPYIDNLFYCNNCKKIQQCSDKFQVKRCADCDFDVCFACF